MVLLCLFLSYYCFLLLWEEHSLLLNSAHISLTRSACGATQLRMRQQVGRTDGGQQGNSEVIRIRTMNSGRQTLRDICMKTGSLLMKSSLLPAVLTKKHVTLTSQLVAMGMLMLPKIGLSWRAIKSPGDPAESIRIWEGPLQHLFLAVAQQPMSVTQCDTKCKGTSQHNSEPCCHGRGGSGQGGRKSEPPWQ